MGSDQEDFVIRKQCIKAKCINEELKIIETLVEVLAAVLTFPINGVVVKNLIRQLNSALFAVLKNKRI